MPKLRSDDSSERQNENSDGSECQNWEAMMAPNAKTEKWWRLWTPKLRSDEGSERQTENSDGYECQNWEVITTPNAETEDATLNVDLKTDDGSERQN